MPSVTAITSSTQFNSILKSSIYVIVDFYADWCGPCKVISPVFEQLASEESKPGRLTFVKVNVDASQDIAQKYGVSAMPTFLVFKNSQVTDTVKGADANALRTVVKRAAAEAARGPAKTSAAFQSKGHVLGNNSASTGSSSSSMPSFDISGITSALNGPGFLSTVIRFLGLYVTSLLSFDSMAAAERSPFAVQDTRKRQ